MEKSPSVTPQMAAVAKYLLSKGFAQHQVAARLNVNQGRISEIKTGKRFSWVTPAEPETPTYQ